MIHIDSYSDKFIILTWGRTGSILLCKKIENNFRANPKYQTNDWSLVPTLKSVKVDNDLAVGTPVAILHSHLLFSRSQINDYQAIFSIRADHVEQILSMYLASQFNKFHLTPLEASTTIKSYELQDWPLLKNFCDSYIGWLRHWLEVLNKNDLVVVYEEFVKNLKNNHIQKPIYPNKEQWIRNYQQIKEFIESNTIENKNLSYRFLNHSNQFDIYKYIT